MSDRGGAITREGERWRPEPRELEFLHAEPPPAGGAHSVADGVLWLRIPLPMELNHINVWLLEDGDGWMLVDTGMSEDVCRWLVERHGAAVWMSEHAHRSSGEFLRTDPVALAERIRGFLHLHGVDVPPGAAAVRGDHREWYGGWPPLAHAPCDGAVIEAGGGRWRVIETAGHCRGHLCLYDAERHLLISGDQVLPTISPNVSVLSSAPDADPLREFLASIGRLRACAPDTLVLPSHGRPFRRLHARLDDLEGHHLQQLDALRRFCVEPRTACDVLPAMFRCVPRGFHRLLAVGEAVAHLNYLCAAGQLERRVDAAGVARFLSL